jgi:hypothetical protein
MSAALLEIYLNDHLAGSAGGVALARRVAGSHRASPEVQTLADEIADDREALLAIVRHLGLRRTRYKEPVAVVAERVGRFKPNGSLVHRSPMSDVVEFEALALAVTGKRAGWRTLRGLADDRVDLDPSELDRLIARADSQLEVIERLRAAAAQRAFTVSGG